MTDRTRTRLTSWLMFFAMVASIESTLVLAFNISSFLRARGFLWPTVKCLFVGAAFTFSYLLAFGARLVSLRVLVRTLPAIACYVYAMVEMRKSPAERFHFLEYGILYLLALRAISIDVPNPNAYLLAWVPPTLSGYLDECLQGLTPQRYFDWGDVRMNAVAAAFSAFICFSLFGRYPQLSRFPFLLEPNDDEAATQT